MSIPVFADSKSRFFRLYGSFNGNYQNFVATSATESANNLFLKRGALSKRATVEDDGSLVFDKSTYADDILGVVAVVLSSRINDPYIRDAYYHVLMAIDSLDRRAVSRHAYDKSPEERDLDVSGFKSELRNL